jgi:hypothetical protein
MATTGYTTQGTLTYLTGYSGGMNDPGLLITMPVSGSITKITAYVANTLSSTSSVCKLYAGSAGARGSLLATTNTSTVTTSFQWLDFTFATPYSASATTYWLEFGGDGGNGPFGDIGQIKYNTGGGTNTSYALNDFAVPVYGTDQYSIYATYTASGGATITSPFISSIRP